MKKSIKIFLYSIASVVVLTAVLLLTTQTPYFRNYLKRTIEEQASAALNGSLHIATLEGSLLSDIELNKIRVSLDGDTLLRLEKLYVDFSPLALLRSAIVLEELLLRAPEVYLKRAESGWNISRLVKSESPDTTAGSSTTPFDWTVQLQKFSLDNGLIEVADSDTLIPRRVEDIILDAAATYRQDSWEFNLRRFAFKSLKPVFILDTLSGVLASEDSLIFARNWRLVTRSNRLQLDGRGQTGRLKGEAKLETAPIELQEFRAFLPGFALDAQPELMLDARSTVDSLYFSANLAWRNQQLNLEARLSALQQWLSENGNKTYAVSLRMQNLALQQWLADSLVPATINGFIELNGQGLEPQSVVASVRAGLTNSRLNHTALERLDLSGNWSRGAAEIDFTLDTEAGKARGKGALRKAFSQPEFQLDAFFNELNLASVLGDSVLSSNLNFKLLANGRGQNISDAYADARLFMARSTIDTFALDTLYSNIRLRGPLLSLDTLHFNSPLGRLDGHSVYNLRSKEVSANLNLRPGKITLLEQVLGADTLDMNGVLKAWLQGKTDSLQLRTAASFSKLKYNAVSVDSLWHEGQFTITKEIVGDARLNTRDLELAGSRLKDLQLLTELRPAGQNVQLMLKQNDSLQLNVGASLKADSLQHLFLHKLDARLYDSHWQLAHSPAHFSFSGGDYASVDSLHWKSDSSGVLIAAGSYTKNGPIDLKTRIEGLPLDDLAQLSPLDIATRGLLYLDARFSGSLQKPRLNGRVNVRHGRVRNMPFKTLKSEFELNESHLFTMRGTLVPRKTDSIKTELRLPLNLFLKDSASVLDREREIFARISSDSLHLAYLEMFAPGLENSKGILSFDARLENSLKDPRLSGFIKTQKASLDIKPYDLSYKDIDLDIQLNQEEIRLEKMRIKQSQGSLEVGGKIVFDGSLLSGKLSELDMQIKAKDFWLVRHPDYEAQISADINSSGNIAAPRFDGDLTVNRSRLFLPALTGRRRSASTDDLNTPMLVSALKSGAGDVKESNQKTIKEPREESRIWKDARGTVRLSIPRNTWIKSPDMRLEISGDLELLKNQPEMELFGSIEIVRGHYEILGRRFNISYGTVTFEGGTDYNPAVELTAAYTFRNTEREKKRLLLEVTGTVEKPTLAFTLDGRNINEGDAMAYLLFGRSLDQLSYGQQERLAASSGSQSEAGLARGIAGGLISAQIASAVGQELNLDYFEIRSQGSLQGAAFIVGKYITNDLFMSYERTVGDIDDDEVAGQKVTLEYELTHWLFLQLIEGDSRESGFDVIFREEWQ